jgi:CheY-like chemotaxis protein
VIIVLMIQPSQQEQLLAAKHGEICDLRVMKPIMRADVGRLLALSRSEAGEDLQSAVAADGAPSSLSAATDNEAPAFARGLRALVAEDNSINQMLANSILRQLGIASDCVEDGAQAVAAAKTGKYNLILMDIRMPVMDGLAATRQIRADTEEGGERLPVIALTANSGDEDLAACRAAGMDDVLIKPITLSDMDRVLRKLIGVGYRTAAE